MHRGKIQYKVVDLVDVNELLSFAKRESKELEEEIKEEQRVEKELKAFIAEIEKCSGQKMHHIGHEKKYGAHLIRFLLHNGGFVEVMVEKPLAIKGHFLSEKTAKEFASALKKVLNRTLPDSPVKSMFIDSVKVLDGWKDEVLTFGKWSQMHKIAIHKTVVVTIVAIFIFVLMEVTKELFHTTFLQFLRIDTLVVSIVTAVFLAIFFEPIKEKVEHFVENFFN